MVEADGRRWHTRERDVVSDRHRDRQALAHGWATVRFTHLDLTVDAEVSLALLRRIGADREGVRVAHQSGN